VQTFLAEAMQYMERLLQDKNRYNAFVTIGLLAVALGNNIETHLRNILVHIKLCLPSRDAAAASQKKRVTHLDPAIFACISMLARALKQSIKSEMADMLDSMLSVGLSPALTTALHELAHYIPAFQSRIADGLLKILSVILMQQSLRHPGMPKRLLLNIAPLGPTSSSSSGSSAPPMSQSGLLGDAHDTQIIVLGLRTLGSFNFEGHSLLQFVRHCADTYLHSEEKEIRLEAVRTCSSLLRGMLICVGNKSQTVLSTINDVLAKLLIAGITDGDPVVRKCVLDNLDCCFDYHLAQAENLSALFIGLNDEVFEIREQTIR
jgi:FKBP12-rapamycin complex-associated protein